MKRRILSTLMALVLCLTLLPAAAYADGGTAVYVSSAGDDTAGNGSQSAPYATLAKAVTEAEDGSTIYVMSNLTMTKCARYYDKDLTITSLDPNNPVTISRGTEFDPLSDPARSQYNPAMIEVQTHTGGEGAGLTLTNIIFDDAGKKEGAVFAQAVSDDGTGTVHNTDYVQDAIIASNATVPTTITLGDGAVLRNFGGMSAVRVTDQAKLVMKSGGKIEDTTVKDRIKGATGSTGPAGAIWVQGASITMEKGSEISNIIGRAVYVDGGKATVGGAINDIKPDSDMWQKTNGIAIHLRNQAIGTLNSTCSIDNQKTKVGGESIICSNACDLTVYDGAVIKNATQTKGIAALGTCRVDFDGEITGLKGNSNALNLQNGEFNVTLGKNANIHDNQTGYGTIYIQAQNGKLDIYGKINNNTASDRGGAIAMGNNFQYPTIVTMYDGAEICNNYSAQTGGGVMVSVGTFTMKGGTISNNLAKMMGGGVYVRRGGSFIMEGGTIVENTTAEYGGGIAYEAGDYNNGIPCVTLNGGTITGNTMSATIEEDSETKQMVASGGVSNDISVLNKDNVFSHIDRYLYISNDATIGNKAVYFQTNTKTVTPAEDSLDIKLGNASTDSVTALSDKATANSWNAPLATFWAQRGSGAELMIDGLTLDSVLPQIVYALVQETDADGKPVPGAVVRVYSTEITTDGIRLTLPNGYANGCAVALAQPTTDFGRVVISGPTEIAKTSDAVTYEVPYTATYTMSGNLLNMLKTASAGIPAMSFVVELDSRLTAKRNADGKFLYDFDGAGILEVDENSITVNGNKITVLCNPVTDWTNAVKNKTSVVMTLKGTGVLAAANFAAGKYLNTTGHIEGAIGSLPVMIPSNVCRTKMTAQTFTVTYRGNGADSGRIADITAYTPGEVATVKANGYTRDGCTFTGWNTEPDGSGAPYKTGDRITMTGNVVLYAQWTRNSSGDDSDTGYTLRLTKLDAENGTPLSGAKFELWRVGTRSDTRLGVYETNRYGWTQAEVSQSGDYYWVETVPPEGYRLGGGKHPTDTGKNSRITVYNAEAAVPALFTDDHYAYIVGVPGGTVRPNDSMTRAGVATIFFRLLKDSIRDANLLTGCTYTDVPDGHWANTAISTMTGLDIVRGYDAAAFGPGDPITRAQFAAICARFDTGKSNGSRTFSDIEGHWAKAYIERAAELGWISGFQDGTFRPDAYITRAQAVTMINRMLNRVPEDPSDLLPGMNVWPDCRPGDWFYLAIQEATNSHDYRHKAGSYETWTGLNADPDWTRYEN